MSWQPSTDSTVSQGGYFGGLLRSGSTGPFGPPSLTDAWYESVNTALLPRGGTVDSAWGGFAYEDAVSRAVRYWLAIASLDQMGLYRRFGRKKRRSGFALMSPLKRAEPVDRE